MCLSASVTQCCGLCAAVDVTTYHRGYHGDLNETMFVGAVSDRAKLLVQTTHECLARATAAGTHLVNRWLLLLSHLSHITSLHQQLVLFSHLDADLSVSIKFAELSTLQAPDFQKVLRFVLRYILTVYLEVSLSPANIILWFS